MKATFWRSSANLLLCPFWLFLTYAMILAFGAQDDGDIQLIATLVWAMISAGLVGVYVQSRAWTHHGIVARIEKELGFKPSQTMERCPVGELPNGCYGWTIISAAKRRDPQLVVIESSTKLHRTPPIHSLDGPILVVRANDGELHMFRFGNYKVPESLAARAISTAKLPEITDHGSLGPDRFIT